MPDLLHSLSQLDIGFLRIIASNWGVVLTALGKNEAARELATIMLDPTLGREVIQALPQSARHAFDALLAEGGRFPWTGFNRQFGEIRPIGPGRRDRDQVQLSPISPVEVLLYHGLIATAFFESSMIIKKVDISRGLSDLSPGRLSSPPEHEKVKLASNLLLDEAVTFLAAHRLGIEPPSLNIPSRIVGEFLRSANLLPGNGGAQERLKVFMKLSPSKALNVLIKAWESADTFNELRQLPNLQFEGKWQNSPQVARKILLEYLAKVPLDCWWNLSAFVNHIKSNQPDFQRPAGDYDSWFIKRASDGVFLRGINTWEEVDGALIRYIIQGPLFWLGKVDLGSSSDGKEISTFRVRSQIPDRDEIGRLTVSSNGLIAVSKLVPRLIRYQVSRFCDWELIKNDEYHYKISITSLRRAERQGLKASQLLNLLAKNSIHEIPPSIVKAIKRWELNGIEARMETQTLLRLINPEVLEELRRSKTGRFLGDVLSPTTVIVKPGAQKKVIVALAELGILAEDDSLGI